MTATSQSTRRKLSLLQLAEELGNVSRACKLMGYHRDTFYEVKRAFQIGGVATLVEQKRGPRNPHPNRVAPDIEQRILNYSLQYPTQGPQRVAPVLRQAFQRRLEADVADLLGVLLRQESTFAARWAWIPRLLRYVFRRVQQFNLRRRARAAWRAGWSSSRSSLFWR